MHDTQGLLQQVLQLGGQQCRGGWATREHVWVRSKVQEQGAINRGERVCQLVGVSKEKR
jgi:hypothetical protein